MVRCFGMGFQGGNEDLFVPSRVFQLGGTMCWRQGVEDVSCGALRQRQTDGNSNANRSQYGSNCEAGNEHEDVIGVRIGNQAGMDRGE